MQRVRVEHKPRRDRDECDPILPLDPRDPDVVRAKQQARTREKDASER